ncbi:MAG: hypothetical protein AABZ60_20980 [Planctomycetota bacterium]
MKFYLVGTLFLFLLLASCSGGGTGGFIPPGGSIPTIPNRERDLDLII